MPRCHSKETPDFFRMWAASRPISRIAAWEYRPSGSTTAVTGVDGWPARVEAAQKIKANAERTKFSVTIPSTKRGWELTRLLGNDYTCANGRLFDNPNPKRLTPETSADWKVTYMARERNSELPFRPLP